MNYYSFTLVKLYFYIASYKYTVIIYLNTIVTEVRQKAKAEYKIIYHRYSSKIHVNENDRRHSTQAKLRNIH